MLVVLELLRDSHSEQVWKKTLQPAPTLTLLGGANSGADFEVHGCLLHAATGQLVPEALRGHVRSAAVVGEELTLTFSEITIIAKPPSLAKRRGGIQTDGTNRYRLLFSLWNTSTLSYVSWQHMSTPLVVRNSFHMLPLEEKNYRRQQYARARGRSSGSTAADAEESRLLPSLPEGEPSQEVNERKPLQWLPLSQAPELTAKLITQSSGIAESFDSEDSSSIGGSASGARESLEWLPFMQPKEIQAMVQSVVNTHPAASSSAPLRGGLPASLCTSVDAQSLSPQLLDCSTREGSCAGGTVVWLHGEHLTTDITVHFGGVAGVDVRICSQQLIKCTSPPYVPLVEHRRHEVLIQILSISTGAVATSAIPFAYIQAAADPEPTGQPSFAQRLLQRLLASLKRAQATSAAASTTGPISFSTVDEHGYTLTEYIDGLGKMLVEFQGCDDASFANASELHLQHQELAAMLTRERLSASLANRPAPELLQQRNILQGPEAGRQMAAKALVTRERLSASLANRPAPELLQERNILQGPEAEQQLAAKRKRLEGFLAERPTPEMLPLLLS